MLEPSNALYTNKVLLTKKAMGSLVSESFSEKDKDVTMSYQQETNGYAIS